MRKLLFLALASSALSGCYPYHHRNRVDPVDACIASTCLVDTCLLDSCLNPRRYDAPPRRPAYHHHGNGCGCEYRWDRGQRLYYYNGHWEYEDGAPW